MKLPGLGEVKDKNVMIGGGVVVGIVAYAYYKRRQSNNAAAAATSTTDTSGVDPNAIDPSTGVPYGQEAGYGSDYYQGSISNPYVSQTGTTTGTGTATGQYTTNTAWYADALTEATNYFGVSFTTATSGFGKYLTQSPSGLNADEYQAVSEVVALLGQPPVGGPFRLIQAAPAPPGGGTVTPPPSGGGSTTPPPSGGGSSAPPPSGGTGIPAGYHMQPAQFDVLQGSESLRQYWQKHYPGNQQALQNLIDYNPSVPVDWTAHWAMSIKTSNAHLVPDK
jgi:hypothetical protein